MKSHFLGKPIRNHRPSRLQKIRRHSIWGSALLVVPFAIFGFLSFSQSQQTFQSETQRSVGMAASRSLASVEQGTTTVRILGAPAQCDFANLLYNGSKMRDPLFPFVPDSLRKDSCAPDFWNRTVFLYFVYKILAILNWFAGAAAIILTVYAGLLYILGYAKEDNAKKAKTLLLGTYVGLVIVFMARILVYGAIDLVSSESAQDAIDSPPSPFVIPKD